MPQQDRLIEIFDKPNSGYAAFEAIKPRIRHDLEILRNVLQHIRPERAIHLKDDPKEVALVDKPKGLKKLTSETQYIQINYVAELYEHNNKLLDQVCLYLRKKSDTLLMSDVYDSVSNYDNFRLEFLENIANSTFFQNAEEREEFKRLMKQQLTAEFDNESPAPDIG